MKQRAQSTPRWHQVLGAVVGEKGRGLKGRIIGKKGRERGEGPASEPRGQTLKCRLCERQGSVIDRRTDHTIYEWSTMSVTDAFPKCEGSFQTQTIDPQPSMSTTFIDLFDCSLHC
ncbi:unnamed protein product [Toxocara canis]|uniref:Uncharacterized protein n=1 Tax=Toxocara canis TaxID=6265 RepID=A0A183UPT5_TOXCA|nr:unnamed protein product [Toxocara canis]